MGIQRNAGSEASAPHVDMADAAEYIESPSGSERLARKKF